MRNKFWHLDSPESTVKLAEWSDKMDFEQIDCPVCGLQGPGKRIGNLDIILPNRPVDDFVWTWYSECLLQDHVVDLFKAEGFTGYDLRPVNARFRSWRKTPPRLRELVVLGWGGVAPPETGIRRLEYCSACGYSHYSSCSQSEKLIDISQWDGSDIFMVWPLPKYIFVTDRVAEAIRSAGYKGVRLIALEDLQQEFVGDGFSPGRLSHSMPDERAREIGGPLGIY